MSDGMHRFQNVAGLQGLESRHLLDEYCYFVAGVVGEMLTELFCAHSAAIARRRPALMRLAPSFRRRPLRRASSSSRRLPTGICAMRLNTR